MTMYFRVTPQTYLGQSLAQLRLHNARLAELQQQAASGLRVQRPSDDPAAFKQIALRAAQDGRFEVRLRGVNTARAALNSGVTQLLDANRLLTQARGIALQGVDSTEPGVLAAEVDRLIERMLDVGNAQDDGRYLFGGTAVDRAPFVVNGTDAQGRPLAVDYVGADQRSEIPVGPYTIATHYTGDEAFQPEGGADAFATLIHLRDTLRNLAGLSRAEQAVEFDAVLGELDAASDNLLATVGEQSASLELLDAIETQTQDLQLEGQETLSELASVDIAQIVLELQSAQNLLQSTLATSALLVDVSLLDFLS
jgi:flagellar hook-associated protein 3 FlgL